MWRFVQDRSHGRNGGIRSFAAFPPNILNLNGKSAFDQVYVASTASEPNLAKTPFSGVWQEALVTGADFRVARIV